MGIVKMISKYVKLTKSGENYLGLCPFHKEKTPSFTVSEKHQRFKCYGCGMEGGEREFLHAFEYIKSVE